MKAKRWTLEQRTKAQDFRVWFKQQPMCVRRKILEGLMTEDAYLEGVKHGIDMSKFPDDDIGTDITNSYLDRKAKRWAVVPTKDRNEVLRQMMSASMMIGRGEDKRNRIARAFEAAVIELRAKRKRRGVRR